MENARIALIEDSELYQRIAQREIGPEHTIVEIAADIGSARELANRIVSGETEIDLVILDGNLSGDTGRDAREIMSILGYPDEPKVPVVGFSLAPFSNYGLVPTTDLGKSRIREISNFIASL